MRKILSIAALAVLFTACKKEQPSSERELSTTNKIETLSLKYQNRENTANRSWKQYAAADAIGGLEMAGWGGSVAGLWGALCGGITGGVFASSALDMFSKAAPNPSNPTLDGNNPTMPTVTVGILEPGITHNAMLNNFLLNSTQYVSENGDVNLLLLQEDCIQQVSSQYGFSLTTLNDIMSNRDYSTLIRYSENPSTYFQSLGDNGVRNVCETFYNTAFAFSNDTDLRAYYADFANIILGANDMTDTEKIRVLTFSGIGTASLLYHNY